MKQIKINTNEFRKIADEREIALKNSTNGKTGGWSAFIRRKMNIMEWKIQCKGEHRRVSRYMRNLQKEV